MQFWKSSIVVAMAMGLVDAQRPMNMSICDYYTTALLKNNTAANQYTLLTLIVNTAVIGNYTQPNVGIKVSGILAPGVVNGVSVNLLPYFNGGLASSNRGGSAGVAINFLDDGGAAPLLKNMPSNGMTSNQYKLLTHLYQFFGSLLGCSTYSMPGFPAYSGFNSMYGVHKFMDLNPAQMGYFIQQVAMSAASFGVAQSDLVIVGTALNSLFNVRCAPPTTVIAAQGPQLQSICIDGACTISPNATCASYDTVVVPKNATTNATFVAPGGIGAATGTATLPSMTATGTARPTTVATAGAVAQGVSFAAAAAGLAAFLI